MDRWFFHTIDLSKPQHMIFFLSLIRQEVSPFNLKGILYSFLLACLNSQHHYPWGFGPLLSKIELTWTQVLLYHNNQFDNLNGYKVTKGQDMPVVVELLSHVWLYVTPWTVAHYAPLSLGFSRQEYWSGLPCPPPGHLCNPGMEPTHVSSTGSLILYN